MKKRAMFVAWAAAGAIALAVSIILVGYAKVCIAKQRAGAALKIADRLAVGKTSIAEATNQMRPFAEYERRLPKAIDPSQNQSFTFENRLMRRLRLSPYRFFLVRLDFRDGLLVEKSALAFVEHDCTVGVTERWSVPEQIPPSISARYRPAIQSL
jgi:hypothetical protein